jgi:hypothetical protein
MAITTMQGVVDAMPGQKQTWRKSPTGLSAGNYYSSWTLAGLPGQGATPSSGLSGDIPTNATTGAYPFVNPASGNTYVGRLQSTPYVANGPTLGVALFDRLWHNSGLSVTSTGAQTINSVALDRPDASGDSVEAWYEVYSVMGAGTPTVTLTYTNSAGTASRSGSSGVLATSMALGRTGQFQLASGDVGVRSIQTWQASATFTSGTIGLVLRRFVAVSVFSIGVPRVVDTLALGLPRVYDDACLEMLFLPMTTSINFGPQSFTLIQG